MAISLIRNLAMDAWLEQQWYRHTCWQLLLWPLSQLFRLFSALRRLAYRSGLLPRWRAPVPVIVIGNISVGGTGKTPLVIWLASRLVQHGWHPGILSRGYRSRVTQSTEVLPDSDATIVGDEPLLLARHTACPVWVGRQRVVAAQALLAAHPECDVLICDDGLQHYALGRDMEIAVIDGRRRHGNGYLLPAGPLREPVARLQQVDAVVVQGGEPGPGEYAMRLVASGFRNLCDPARNITATALRQHDLHAVAGIGDPQRFFDTLHAMDLEFVEHPFPDHHPYRPVDLQFTHAKTVLMTEKDAVKCVAFARPEWWYVAVEAQVDADLERLVLCLLEEKYGR